ncbi:helix-turn-helix transcriptional regulator [Paenibacillus thermotolerans]|uniref:helix-turn-helix transcriptional regulator n=1 Tax=Paenibacillus thermotolerans TaxID=3027807 RepID=UPI002368F23C|nr:MULTISPECIES: WYL domain-containing protein [unclassified Paenibacillus]
MRADRLLTILLLLQEGKRWTVKELAERLEVSERTVSRDMEALSASGVPVYADRGYGGGWRLSEGYRTALNGMSEQDVRLLLLAQMSRLFDDLGIRRQSERLLDKLSAAGLTSSSRREANAVKEKIHIDGAGWTESMERFPHLPALYDAVWNEKTVVIRYAREEETVERELHPLGLVAKGSVWYIVGAVDGEIRTYRASRVLDVKEGAAAFERPAAFSLADYWERSTREFRSNIPKYPATVRVKTAAIRRLSFIRFVNVQVIGTEGEWATAAVDFQTPEYACGAALSLGTDLIVVEPAELRQAVKDAASGIAALYSGFGTG